MHIPTLIRFLIGKMMESLDILRIFLGNGVKVYLNFVVFPFSINSQFLLAKLRNNAKERR